MVEIAFREVDKGVIEAKKSMGANMFTIIGKVLIPEALPAIISGITVTAISLLVLQRWLVSLAQAVLGILRILKDSNVDNLM